MTKRSSRTPYIAAAFVTAAIGLADWCWSQESRPPAFVAIDGDTIKSAAGVRYRLLGYDAPETALADCIAELDLGTSAKRRLQALIDTGAAQLVESRKKDAAGRTLASLYIAGMDVGRILIAEGLARPYSGSRQNWCE